MDVIEREWGVVEGELKCQGVLNTAFRLRGEEIFNDRWPPPNACTTCGVHKDYFVTANCVVSMIAGAHYREFVMPCDRKFSNHYPCFGIHNCGWKVDAYSRAYSEIRALDYRDFGIQSDLRQLKALFASATLSVIRNPDDVIGRPGEVVRATLERLHEELETCRIILGSLDGRTPSAEVEAFFDAVADVWGVPVHQLVPPPRFG